MAKRNKVPGMADLHETLWPGETRLPEEKRFSEGDEVWLIADPPSRATVVRDSGHPRWLTIQTSSPDGDAAWETARREVRTSERRAARAMVAQLRRQARAVLLQADQLRQMYGLP